MKRVMLLLALAGFVVSSAGSKCTTLGISPLATKDARIVDAALAGKWVEIDDKGKPEMLKVVVEKDGNDNSYLATLTEPEEPFAIVFRVIETDIDGVKYVDVMREPILTTPEARDFADWTIPAHSYGRIEKNGDKLKLSFLQDKASTAATLKGAGVAVQQVVETVKKTEARESESLSVSTSDTATLRAALTKVPASAFDGVVEFQRQKN